MHVSTASRTALRTCAAIAAFGILSATSPGKVKRRSFATISQTIAVVAST